MRHTCARKVHECVCAKVCLGILTDFDCAFFGAAPYTPGDVDEELGKGTRRVEDEGRVAFSINNKATRMRVREFG